MTLLSVTSRRAAGERAGRVAGGVDATGPLQATPDASAHDGAQPRRVCGRVPRGRATPPATRPARSPAALVRLAPEKRRDLEVAVADLALGFGPRVGEPPSPLRRRRRRDRARGARQV